MSSRRQGRGASSHASGEAAGPAVREDTPRPLPPQATMGLLDYIASTALDADYAVAARRREAASADGAVGDDGNEGAAAGPRDRAARAGTTLVLLAFALLLSVAAVQSARSEPVEEEGRASLVQQAQDRRDRLAAARARVLGLRQEVADLQRSQLASTQEGRELQSRLAVLGGSVGARPVTGPGMVVTVDDAPQARSDRQRVLDTDLQRLVNGLWLAGAEAVAINNQRLSQLTAIRTAGEAITVNFKPLRRPYVVSAIGNPDQLPARFIETSGGSWWLNLRSVYDVRFDMNSREELIVPAVELDDLRHARVPGGAR